MIATIKSERSPDITVPCRHTHRHPMNRLLLLLALAGLCACTTPRKRFERAIDNVVRGCDARIGIAIGLPGREAPLLRNDTLLPMMSIFKVPVALAVLDRAAAEAIPLTTRIAVGAEWLDRDTYSPMRDSLPEEGGTATLADLLRYSVSQSDNIACDLLIDFAGGIGAVNASLERRGLGEIRISATERDMHRTPELQRANTARPTAICRLFEGILRGEQLEPRHAELLRRLLEETSTGAAKLRAGVPRDAVLGHKTGSSDRDAAGRRIADNDAGYIILRDGRVCTIAVLVTSSAEEDATAAAAIAAISRLTCEYLIKTQHERP